MVLDLRRWTAGIGEEAKPEGSARSLYGSKAGQVVGGFGVLRQAATAASVRLLLGLRLPRDGHGGDGRRSELSRVVVERRDVCGRRHGDGRLAGVAFWRTRWHGRRRRVPEQREEDPQGPGPYSQQVR